MKITESMMKNLATKIETHALKHLNFENNFLKGLNSYNIEFSVDFFEVGKLNEAYYCFSVFI